jgi:DNA invertase Pin-like site-specific DNA recombinase
VIMPNEAVTVDAAAAEFLKWTQSVSDAKAKAVISDNAASVMVDAALAALIASTKILGAGAAIAAAVAEAEAAADAARVKADAAAKAADGSPGAAEAAKAANDAFATGIAKLDAVRAAATAAMITGSI